MFIPPGLRCLFLLLLAILLVPDLGRADDRSGSLPLDSINMGEQASEKSHALEADKSDVITGGLGQSARTLSAGGEVAWESAPMTFTMKVNPTRQNYFTVKLWGGDKGEESGRLILFAEGLQVGYRNQGDYDVLNQTNADPEAPGRFVYQTIPLPISLTKGKDKLSFKMLALGPIWVYGATFDKEQKPFTGPSRGIYSVYTNTDGYFQPPKGEVQGKSATAALRSTPGEEVIDESRQIVVDRLSKLVGGPARNISASDVKELDSLLRLLGQAYKTAWTPAYHNSAVIDQVLQYGDAVADSVNNDPKSPVLHDWSGAGPLGEAIINTWPDLGQRLEGASSQKLSWASALRKSVDYWRTHRRSFTNQSMIVDYNIYTANRALALLDSSKALPETQALNYLYQATGLEPWVGSDLSADVLESAGTGGPQDASASEAGFGHNYFLITKKGLSRELGYVGGYGETILRFAHDMAVMTGDDKIRQQLDKIEHARLYFRYPGVDGEGFVCMKLASEIDNRGAEYPMTGGTYNATGDRENWWMDVPALLSDDPVVVGVAQQAIADGQYYAYIGSRLKDPDTLGMMLNVDDYEKVKSLPSSSARLPMTPGQPDFVFSDEQDAIVALKQGDTRLYVNFYYRAERAVNRVARIWESTPSLVRIATVKTDPQINESGQTYTRPDWLDNNRTRGFMPPGQDIHQAWSGEELPIAKRPDDATQPSYGDFGPFVGKASFYWLRYGDYLIGLNTTEDQTFTLETPSETKSGKDLVSGIEMDLAKGVKVGPLTTVVLDLGEK